MNITLFDVLFLAALIAGAAWGFGRGIFRQAANTLVIYMAAVISTLTYRSLSRMLGGSGPNAAATDMASFIILMGVLNILFALLINDLIKHIDISQARIWVNFGGMLFGFLNTVIWCAVILIIVRSATGGDEWYGYKGVQQFFVRQTRNSWMAYAFGPFMRLMLDLIRPWLFGRELPPLLLNAL